MYLSRLVKEITNDNIYNTVNLSNDNQGAQALAYNPIHHAKTKHIDIRYHLVREAVEKGLVNLKYIKSEELMADVMTKGLAGPAHYNCISKFGLTNASLRGSVGD